MHTIAWNLKHHPYFANNGRTSRFIFWSFDETKEEPDFVLTGVCGPAEPEAGTEGSRCWLWHWWRRLLHGRGEIQESKEALKWGHNVFNELTDYHYGDVTFQSFGVEVLGLDLSENMVNIAMDRAISEKLPSVCPNVELVWIPQIERRLKKQSVTCSPPQVQFEVADATKRTFPEGSFDVVYSRDTILHIDDKLALFKRFHVSIFLHRLWTCNVEMTYRLLTYPFIHFLSIFFVPSHG